jgi:hypothetical protein
MEYVRYDHGEQRFRPRVSTGWGAGLDWDTYGSHSDVIGIGKAPVIGCITLDRSTSRSSSITSTGNPTGSGQRSICKPARDVRDMPTALLGADVRSPVLPLATSPLPNCSIPATCSTISSTD